MAFWRKKKTRSAITIPIAVGDVETVGYTRLSDNPDVLIAVDKVADLVSNMTIHLMENTDEGDKRLRNQLSRKIDIEPHRNMTRKSWIYKIVSDLLLHGDGNSIVHIGMDPKTTYIADLTPFQMQAVSYEDVEGNYLINFNGTTYTPDEVIHFVINPHPNYPYRGTGYRVALKEIVKNLNQATKTKNNFMSGKYMPSLIISVDAMTEELSSKAGRDSIMEKYFSETEGGKPWIIPANLMNVEQVKPLSLKDIAINEGVELDKKTVAGLFGIPAFFLGVGDFNKEEYNNFINTRIFSIGQVIAQTLTRDLLLSPNWFFRLNPRSLYSYNLSEMVEAGTQMVDRNAMRRNELRDWVGLDPDAEMQELIILENYIPANKIGSQNKLKGGENDE
ncbi:phage portal protein [Bacillus cereus]|uniref:HK97 family phage portal protein n=1 Tax=Bacillus cereus HuB4-4 TaxID=1053211 RepID=A0A9W5QY74_BACCE|nr:phage portal protein [Bacillus cereus]EOP94826.1 HK97 family phage portal protein [Bacillus cereus HuB4-4]UPJ15585.1 phage portal protein [Bacillus cereus]